MVPAHHGLRVVLSHLEAPMDLVALEAQAPHWHHWVRGVLAVLVAQADLELRRHHLFPMGQTNREYFGLYRASKFLKKES